MGIKSKIKDIKAEIKQKKDVKDELKRIDLYEAVKNDDVKTVEKLLKFDKNTGLYPEINSNYLLHSAVREKSYKVMKLLLDNGADVNLMNKNGMYVLDTAILSDSLKCGAILKNRGAIFNISNIKRYYSSLTRFLTTGIIQFDEIPAKTFIEDNFIKYIDSIIPQVADMERGILSRDKGVSPDDYQRLVEERLAGIVDTIERKQREAIAEKSKIKDVQDIIKKAQVNVKETLSKTDEDEAKPL